MFDQVARKHIYQALGNQSYGCSKDVGPGPDAAQGETVINEPCGQDVYAPADHYGPEAVFQYSFIDAGDEIAFSYFLLKVVVKGQTYHEEGGNN